MKAPFHIGRPRIVPRPKKPKPQPRPHFKTKSEERVVVDLYMHRIDLDHMFWSFRWYF